MPPPPPPAPAPVAEFTFQTLQKLGVSCCAGRTRLSSTTDPKTACHYAIRFEELPNYRSSSTVYVCGKRYELCDVDRAKHVGLCAACHIPVPASDAMVAKLNSSVQSLFAEHAEVSDEEAAEETAMFLCGDCRSAYELGEISNTILEQMALTSGGDAKDPLVYWDDLKKDLATKAAEAKAASDRAARIEADKKTGVAAARAIVGMWQSDLDTERPVEMKCAHQTIVTQTKKHFFGLIETVPTDQFPAVRADFETKRKAKEAEFTAIPDKADRWVCKLLFWLTLYSEQCHRQWLAMRIALKKAVEDRPK